MLVMGIEVLCNRLNNWNCHIVELVVDVHVDAAVGDFNAMINSI